MVIIGGMSVIDVVIFGIQRLRVQRRVHQSLANPPIGIRKELGDIG